MTAATPGSAALLALADKIEDSLACTRTYAMREWAIIEKALRLAAKPDGVREALDAGDLYIQRLHTIICGKPVRDMEEVALHWTRASLAVRAALSTTGQPKP